MGVDATHGQMNLPAVTGAWRPGMAPALRSFATLGHPFVTEGGDVIGTQASPVTVAYETYGSLNEDHSNAILLLHALTGDAHAAGPAGPGQPTEGWWDAFIGPGRVLDTERFFIVSPNVLGGCQGTTGPSSLDDSGRAWGSRFPRITIRDQVRVEMELADLLAIDAFHAVIGGSMGGMRALEWSLLAPERVERLILLATGAAATAEQIALCHVQIEAIRRDPKFRNGDYYEAEPGDGPWQGLGIARSMGQITYRARAELIERFGRSPQEGEDPLAGGRFSVEGYLDYQASKLNERFDANSYALLSQAMNLHDVGRGRGGVVNALRQISAETTVIGFDSDRLYVPDEQQLIAQEVPGCERLILLSSHFGHDAFLLEFSLMAPHLIRALA